MASNEEVEISDLNKEFEDQLDKLSLHLTNLACNESLATSRLNSLMGRQEKTLEKMEAIEKVTKKKVANVNPYLVCSLL